MRKWTVIDWCNYNERNHTGIYEYVQVLKISNDEAPKFDVCKDVTVDVFDNCKGRVVQSKSATDDCTPSNKIKYTYTIDLYSDGVNDNLTGNTDSFDRILPVGRHKVKWTADDLCGNVEVCTYFLTVRDGKKPTPYCLSSVTTVVMPSTGSIGIWAKDFDYGSTDNCTPKNKLKFSFSADLTDTGRIISCSDIPDGKSLTLPLRMWVTDEAGNQEYCDVSVIIQDNTGNICPDNNNPILKFGGEVVSTKGQPIANVDVVLSGTSLSKKITTIGDGLFDFSNIRPESDLILSAEKSDNIRNGLNTIDLILIQKHVLSLDKFKDAYQLVASDFDKDGRTSVQDLVSIRKVILGMETKMPDNGKPWRFINAATMKGNDLASMTYEEKIYLAKNEGNRTDLKFVGLRLGDVDDSAAKSALNDEKTENRNAPASLVLKKMSNEKMEVFIENIEELYGLQFSLQGLKEIGSVNITGGQLSVSGEEYFITEDGRLNMSWFSGKAMKINKDKALFTIHLPKKQAEEVDVFFDENFDNEAYDGSMNVRSLKLKSYEETMNLWSVAQNTPNPFNRETSIEVHLPRQGQLVFRVYDGLGRMLQNETMLANAGSNFMRVQADKLSGPGMYIYEVNFNGERKLSKMLLTE